MKQFRDIALESNAEYIVEPIVSWEYFSKSEGMGVDSDSADIKKLDIHTRSIATQLIAWANNPQKTLYLWGAPGCGKTFAGIAILKHVFNKYKRPWIRYLEASLITDIGKKKGTSFLQDTYAECDLLMVDDLGVSMPAEWEQRYTYDLFDRRCQRLDKPTIVTSNLSKKELTKVVTERVVSRLRGQEFEFITGDLRN